MAEKTKLYDQKTTAKKTTAKKTTPQKDSSDFPKAYIRLRTVLDGLEISALRFCLDNTNTEEKIRRAREIEARVMPIIKELQENTSNILGECPDGFFDCGGFCLPYQCPFSEIN